MRTRRTVCNWDPDLERVELLDDNEVPLGDVWFEPRPASPSSEPPSSASPPSTNPGATAPAPSSVPVFALAIVFSLIAATLAGAAALAAMHP